MNRNVKPALAAALLLAVWGCEDEPGSGLGGYDSGVSVPVAGGPGSVGGATGGPGTAGGPGAAGGPGSAAGPAGTGGPGIAGGPGAPGAPGLDAGSVSGTSGATGTAGGAGMAGGGASGLAPSIRNPKYRSVAPALGMPLPPADPGVWKYIDIEGAKSRDGTSAGFYYKHSKSGNKNLLIFMPGGGACQDNFFCNMNPPNKDFSLTAESIGSGILNVLGPNDEPQDPNGERWKSGILKDDPNNPVKDWNMVYIPYVTGDVFAGAKPNATVPGVDGTFQFVGRTNMLKFLARIVPTFRDAPVVLLTGSSAGGLGALLTAPFVIDSYIDLNLGARVFVVNDAGPFFDDPYLEVCLQQRYRDLFGLNDSFPEDCPACKGSGGGIAKNYIAYLVDKYPEGLLGGLIDSESDEIMSFFFSEGLDDCSYIDNPLLGIALYPEDRYKAGLKNLLDVHLKRMSSYIWPGIEHQNLFMTDWGDRFYDNNGLSKTPAQWLANLLAGNMERVGL
jgi:hypothetical protein